MHNKCGKRAPPCSLGTASRPNHGDHGARLVLVNDPSRGDPFTSTRRRGRAPRLAGALPQGGPPFCTCELLASAGSSQVQNRRPANRKVPAKRVANRRRNVPVNRARPLSSVVFDANAPSCASIVLESLCWHLVPTHGKHLMPDGSVRRDSSRSWRPYPHR
jgi:hypothetical protein